MTTETWFELEWSWHGTGDWYTAGEKADDPESLSKKIERWPFNISVFDYRIVKVTLTKECVK